MIQKRHLLLMMLAPIMLSGCDAKTILLSPKIKEAQMAVKEKLNDPESAQFENVVISGDAVCGWVNSKNKFGGYVGATMFLYNNNQVKLQEMPNFFWNIEFDDCIRGSKNEEAIKRYDRGFPPIHEYLEDLKKQKGIK
ncbi:MAG: hypothetical protein J0L55_15360 [Caulobacterales bacterium]|nr:hypothetical protein [Caulobacterales bacterium]